MMGYDILDAIGGIDPKYIETADAEPEVLVATSAKKPRLTKWLAMAACLVLVVGVISVINNGLPGSGDTGLSTADVSEESESGETGPAVDNPSSDEQLKEDAVIIPKTKVSLPSEYSEVDMMAFFIYNGRSYVQYYGNYGNDNISSKLKGEYLGTVKGSIDEWTSEDDYIDMTGSIGGAIYTVKGFDPEHVLCMEWSDGAGLALYINNNDLTINTGSDILEDIFGLSKKYKTLRFETADSYYNSRGEIKKIGIEYQDIVRSFINDMDQSGYTVLTDSADIEKMFDNALYFMYFDIGNGINVQLTLYANSDLVRIKGFGQLYLKLNEGSTLPIIEAMSTGK